MLIQQWLDPLLGTNEVRDAVSSAVGSYRFDNLLPATYEITAEATGFKTYQQANMILRANTAASINLPLVVGGTEQRVDVTAEAVLLDTQTATNSVTLDVRQVLGNWEVSSIVRLTSADDLRANWWALCIVAAGTLPQTADAVCAAFTLKGSE